MTQAPTPPGSGCRCGRAVPSEKPRQFQARWKEAMAPLPGQVLSPLAVALNSKLSARRRRALDAAIRALHDYRASLREWFESIDAMMDRRGMEYVDPHDPAQADAFVERLGDSGRRALEKRRRIEAAMAYAEMTIDWIRWELAHGD